MKNLLNHKTYVTPKEIIIMLAVVAFVIGFDGLIEKAFGG